ncbi:MAG: hypothetical protein Q9222_003853 [Ikaeria aurantiellina]
MDPLSLTASLIAIIGAAKTGSKALQKLTQARKAPGEVGDLLGELTSFQALLEETKDLVGQNKSLRCGEQLQSLVHRGGEITGEINTLIQQTWPSIHFLKLSEANRQRVTVLRNGTRLKTLKDGLRLVSLDLAAALSLLTASSSVQLVDATTASAQLHQENSNNLSNILQRMTFLEEDTRRLQETTGKLAMPMNDYVSAMSRYDLVDSASGASVPSSMALTLTPDFDDSSDFEQSCRRTAVSAIKVTYHLPKFLMSRYIKFALEHNPLDGPNLSVRMPRVMEWQHELFRCANLGDLRGIQSLFSEGKASPYDVNPRGSNALIYAAAHGNPELGRFLLEAGADAELTDSSGRKPIELFFERSLSGQFDNHNQYLVKKMFKGTTYMEGRRFTTLHKIVLGFVDLDLKDQLKVSTSTINDCDAEGRTPLCWATIRDDQSAVETLLSFGADPDVADYTGSTCLHFARSAGVCRLLLDKKADVHTRNRLYSRTPLHSFCKRDGTVEMIDQLVKAGLEVDARDADGETPLLNAIFRGFTAAAERLLDLGADPNACNVSSRESSVHFAVGFNRHDILPLLLRKGADYTATNIRGRSIGHMVARVADARMIKILSSSNLVGLDLSLKDSFGNTPADYLLSRKLMSESEVELLHAAFGQLHKSCHMGKPIAGPDRPQKRYIDANDIEAQAEQKTYQLPGAFPEPAGQHDRSKDEVWRDTVSSFRCNYKSPCCYVFDAPRGVCSGVISYQSQGQVS